MGMEKKCENCGTEITKEYCEGYPEVCEHWTPKKPMTNGDRIRAMSDEELAKFLCRLIPGDACSLKCPANDMCRPNRNGLIAWMNEPYKEDD